MKRLFVLILVFLLLPVTVSAHSGKTDSNGGHWDHSKGEYHYHHGYPAHGHYDMDGDGAVDCPYLFDDKTNHGSGGNSGPIVRPSPTTEPTGQAIVLPSSPEPPSYSFPVWPSPENPTYNQPAAQEDAASDGVTLLVCFGFFAFIGWCIWYGRRS